MFPLTRAFVRAVEAPIFGRSGGAALRAAFGGGSASRCHGAPSAPSGGSPTSADPSPRSVEPSFASAGGQLQNIEPQSNPKLWTLGFQSSVAGVRRFSAIYDVLLHFRRTPAHPKIRAGSQTDPLEGPCWGAWFSQALAGQVVGVRTLRAAPRGFGPKGRKRGPAEGGRGEVNLPL